MKPSFEIVRAKCINLANQRQLPVVRRRPSLRLNSGQIAKHRVPLKGKWFNPNSKNPKIAGNSKIRAAVTLRESKTGGLTIAIAFQSPGAIRNRMVHARRFFPSKQS